MFRTAGFIAFVLAVQLGLATQALACKGDKVLFEDDFTTHDPTWGTSEEQFQIKNGKATLRPPVANGLWHWNTAFAFENVDICVTVTPLDVGDPTQTDAGLLFWVQDNDNFFVLLIAANGKYAIARKLRGNWVADPLFWTETDAMKRGVNQPNTVRLTLKGQSIAVAFNDKEVSRLRAQAPEGPSYIGLYAESGPDKPSIWQFGNLKVTNVK
jgi:hypothetical protein